MRVCKELQRCPQRDLDSVSKLQLVVVDSREVG